MKLESLKSSKFDAFKENEIKNPLAITGGLRTATTWYELGNPDNKGTDTWCTGADESAHVVVFDERGDMIWNHPILDPGNQESYNQIALELHQ